MRRVVFNQKGGVGKSSITVNLAAISAAQGKKTLIVDLDPQCNASQYVLGMEAFADGGRVSPDIGTFFNQTLSFSLKAKDPRKFVHDTRFDNLSIVPASTELGDIEHLLESKHKIYKLRGMLKALEREFDVIYVDTPPAFNFYTLSALIACDRCLIPFDCDAFSRQALYTLLGNIQETIEDHNEALEVEGIIVNQFQARAKLPRQLIEELKKEGLPLLDTYLASSVIMRESHDKATPLVKLAPKHKLTAQFHELHAALA